MLPIVLEGDLDAWLRQFLAATDSCRSLDFGDDADADDFDMPCDTEPAEIRHPLRTSDRRSVVGTRRPVRRGMHPYEQGRLALGAPDSLR